MSKYELRSEEIKSSALENGWRVTWRLQGARLYATVITLGANPLFGGHEDAEKWLKQWYSEPILTSGRFGHWTFMVCDLIDALKKS